MIGDNYRMFWVELYLMAGPLYPPNLENRNWLSYYSSVFDFVEIDSTFYRIPAKYMVQNWANRTPHNFKFTAKFPK